LTVPREPSRCGCTGRAGACPQHSRSSTDPDRNPVGRRMSADLLERLAAANPVHTADLAPSIDDVWRKLDDAPLPQPARRSMRTTVAGLGRRGVRRLGGVGVSVAITGIALLVLGTTGAGPSSAFAGWTATPTSPASGETRGALDRCRSQLAAPAGGGASEIPSGGWQPGITDTRGPFTAMVLRSGSASAMCLSGPSFTSAAATVPGSYLQQWRLARSTQDGSAAPSSMSGLGFSVPRSGPIITQALRADLATSPARRWPRAAVHVRGGTARRRRHSPHAGAIERQRRPSYGREPVIHRVVAGQRLRQRGAGGERFRTEHAAVRAHPTVGAPAPSAKLLWTDRRLKCRRAFTSAAIAC
jgi:hypothetical protein